MAKEKTIFAYSNDSVYEKANSLLNEITVRTGYSKTKILEYFILCGLDEIFQDNTTYDEETISRLQSVYQAISTAFNLDR